MASQQKLTIDQLSTIFLANPLTVTQEVKELKIFYGHLSISKKIGKVKKVSGMEIGI